MPSEAAKEARKRYLEKLKVEDPERYKRYKAKGKYKKKSPYVPIVHNPTIVAANRSKRRSKTNGVRLKRVKNYLVYIKSHFTCLKCPESYIGCLEFHHVDPISKIDDISSTLHNGSIKKLTDEILKCVILCSNCHKKVHGGILNITEPTIDYGTIEKLKDEFIEKFHPTYNEYLEINILG